METAMSSGDKRQSCWFVCTEWKISLTLGGLLNELVSMIFPPWKLESDPMENQDVLEATDLTLDVERMEPVDLTERLEP